MWDRCGIKISPNNLSSSVMVLNQMNDSDISIKVMNDHLDKNIKA